MITETKLNQTITDTTLNPSKVLEGNNISFNAFWNSETGEFKFETINGETISQSQYDTWKSAKTVAEWIVNPLVAIRASAKAKLIAGEALTEDEASTIVL
tara:strand:+ start:2265 stop:2564 length:300 start_codon:yes stop_codon:yes gene_type:complete